ncbi:hypothetical protein PYCCODRAFT_1270482 [Trametes coccinea BRFM310]|uniref:Uncharacterized protein n=1 Tax=Trametes coccinea (strain BRFM310) TaxID=1353009 RepID=A0A1Y2IV62_TRAC3|nr:hypothetical protein PYCCODRAFT_1270482 [Trametes coccinea BRFM310]
MCARFCAVVMPSACDKRPLAGHDSRCGQCRWAFVCLIVHSVCLYLSSARRLPLSHAVYARRPIQSPSLAIHSSSNRECHTSPLDLPASLLHGRDRSYDHIALRVDADLRRLFSSAWSCLCLWATRDLSSGPHSRALCRASVLPYCLSSSSRWILHRYGLRPQRGRRARSITGLSGWGMSVRSSRLRVVATVRRVRARNCMGCVCAACACSASRCLVSGISS